MIAPFSETLSEIVTIPKASVKDCRKPLVPKVDLFGREGPFDNAGNGLLVAFDYGIYIFGTAGTAFNLEYGDAGTHHFVDETDGF